MANTVIVHCSKRIISFPASFICAVVNVTQVSKKKEEPGLSSRARMPAGRAGKKQGFPFGDHPMFSHHAILWPQT
jgi:hypothetical protein